MTRPTVRAEIIPSRTPERRPLSPKSGAQEQKGSRQIMNTATNPTRASVTAVSNAVSARRAAHPTPRIPNRKNRIAVSKAATNRVLKPDSPSLSETIRLAQQGDAQAFEEIYRLHARRVYMLCLRMLGDPSEAEDLAQEAFMLLFRKIHTFRGESAFSSWLHRLTANVVLMGFRKRRALTTSLDEITRVNDEDTAPRLEIGGPDLRLAGVFDRVNLQTAIDQLPEGYKRMFLLHDVHGYEHNEIAEILDCSIGNSKSQLHKARKRLRELLRKVDRCRLLPPAPVGEGSFAIAGG
jgi:RNA polymerase sigma-70 factor (ECF subfamily)